MEVWEDGEGGEAPKKQRDDKLSIVVRNEQQERRERERRKSVKDGSNKRRDTDWISNRGTER